MHKQTTNRTGKTGKIPAARVAYAAVFIALALIFSYVETLIPISFAVPGIKLGLANLVIMVGLFLMPAGEVLLISVARILLVGFLFGNGASIMYSLAGGILSFVVMLLLLKLTRLSILGISICGAAAHNIGQLIVAALVVQNFKMVYYLPVLLVAGVVTGTLIGILAGRIVPVLRRIDSGRQCS